MLGVFGEAARLTAAERRTVVETVVASCNLPLVVGISSLDLDDVLAEAANVAPAAADRLAGLMIQVNTPDPGALSKHLATVARDTDRPIVVQDYPVITGIPIATADLVEAVQAISQVVAVKSEFQSGIAPGLRKHSLVRPGDRLRRGPYAGRRTAALDAEGAEPAPGPNAGRRAA